MTSVDRHQAGVPAPSAWEYAPAPESRDVLKLNERYGLYVGGAFVDPASGMHFTTISPAT
jgi:aldehyde dehydrogenase (NAD+)